MEMNMAVAVLEEQGIEARLSTTRKNGIDLPCIQVKGEGQVSPVIYEDAVESMNEEAFVAFARKALEGTPNFDVYRFFNPEFFLEHVVSCIRHKTDDDQIVKYDAFEDLEEYFRVIIDEFGDGNQGSIVVRPEHLEQLGINPEQLREAGRKNLRDIVEISPMINVLQSITGSDDFVGSPIDNYMFLATSRSHIFGASVILLEDVLEDFCQRYNFSRLCLIPSSIHEALILDGSQIEDESYINDMINEVNEIVDPTERLSTHLYTYTSTAAEVA